MFDKKRPNSEAVGRIKNLIKQKLGLPETTIVSVVELACHEPGCPPTETIITAHAEDSSKQNWRINKPISEISDNDISIITGQVQVAKVSCASS